MSATRKITIHVPQTLLDQARESTGLGITETVRRGLELLSASAAYRKLRRLRGKVALSWDIEALREDRRRR